MYYVTGGMPEPVLMWTEARDVSAMQEALSGIIGAYERDFAKHPNLSEFPKISMIWKSIPSQLARENKKFICNCSVGLRIYCADRMKTWACRQKSHCRRQFSMDFCP